MHLTAVIQVDRYKDNKNTQVVNSFSNDAEIKPVTDVMICQLNAERTAGETVHGYEPHALLT